MTNRYVPGIETGACAGRCYYCGRDLVCAAPLAEPKYSALKSDQLTCGPCVYVHGRLPWRHFPGQRGPTTKYQQARLTIKRAMQ